MNRRTRDELIRLLRRDADRICLWFGLRYRSIEPERANVKRRYGICYDDGSIKIRLRHVSTGEPLKYSSLVNTLCHELAHLKHFNHGPQFQAFYARLLAWSRQEGIYRPGPRVDVRRRPIQEPAWLTAPELVVVGSVGLRPPDAPARRPREPRRPESTRTRADRPVQLDLFG